MNDTHGSFNDVLGTAPRPLRPLCRALRRVIVSLHPGYTEVVWPRQQIASFGIGPKKMSEHYAYIGVQRSHVNLGFYQGAALRDPTGLLEGTGKNLRHIKVRDTAGAMAPAVAALLRQAIDDRKRALRKSP